jgi:uncharacterized membrane protein YgdD (TMEM256/DUF423 family)
MRKAGDFLTIWAGLMGACGIGAAAASAHLAGGEHLSSVALILLVHAAAVLALITRAQDTLTPRPWLLAAAVLTLGASLFSADVALLTLRGARLFPMAAPIGGTTMIVGWLAVAVAAARRTLP